MLLAFHANVRPRGGGGSFASTLCGATNKLRTTRPTKNVQAVKTPDGLDRSRFEDWGSLFWRVTDRSRPAEVTGKTPPALLPSQPQTPVNFISRSFLCITVANHLPHPDDLKKRILRSLQVGMKLYKVSKCLTLEKSFDTDCLKMIQILASSMLVTSVALSRRFEPLFPFRSLCPI